MRHRGRSGCELDGPNSQLFEIRNDARSQSYWSEHKLVVIGYLLSINSIRDPFSSPTSDVFTRDWYRMCYMNYMNAVVEALLVAYHWLTEPEAKATDGPTCRKMLSSV